MKIIHKNKKEDIKLLIDLGADYHGEDIVLTFSAGQYGLNKYICSYVGGVQTNCVVNNSTVLCLLDNHGLSLGMLSVEIEIRVPDSQMPDGDFRHVTKKIASFVLGGEECSLELTNGASDYFPEELVPESVINLLPTVIKGEPGKDADIEGCNAAIASAKKLEEAVAKAEAERKKAENERQSSETERKQSEEARLQSESERNKTEQARKLAEEERNEAEASRNTAETQRVEAEIQRQKDVEDAIASMESAERKATDATIAAQSATENANAAAERANEAADLVYNGPEEVVSVALYSAVEGVSTSGLDLYVYINDNSVPLVYTTNENGMATFRVTKGLRYDIVFPDITGCAPIGRLSYTAALQTRGIEVTYQPLQKTQQEHVTISFRRYEENATWQGGTAYPDGVAHVTIDGVETTYHADSNGMADFFVDLGKEYTVQIEKPADLHLVNGVYNATYTADRSARVIAISLHAYLSDFLLVDTNGSEWTYDGFINSGKDPSEAILIHVATEELLAAGCDYYLSLHVLAYGNYHGTSKSIPIKTWAAQNVQFTSVPVNPSKDDPLYYDGYKSTYLIINEGLDRGIATDCHTFTTRETIQLGLDTLYGYTPTKGQYEPLIANYDYINDMVLYARPDGNPVMKFWRMGKGTSTQQSKMNAYTVSSFMTNTPKTGNDYAPVPAYAKTSL